MTVEDIITLTEYETGASDWLDGSHGLCWPHYLALCLHFRKVGLR